MHERLLVAGTVQAAGTAYNAPTMPEETASVESLPSTRAVAVSAPARLHLGFIDPDAMSGRRFGSIGLGLEGIATQVEVHPAAESSLSGAVDARAAHLVELIRSNFSALGPSAVCLKSRIPEHAGLGSGTQLALALGTAMTASAGIKASPEFLAERLNRGRRSGIGVSLFRHGGIHVDAGHSNTTAVPPLVAHAALPAPWRVVLVFDHSCQGLSGSAEKDAFQRLPQFPLSCVEKLCRLTLMGLLPAIHEADFEVFAAAIGQIQMIIGDHFAAVQDGRYTSADVAAALHFCAGRFALKGFGQSSWGPTGFIFAPDAATAETIVAACRQQFAAESSLEFGVYCARNSGASIDCLPPEAG